jgi:hypothetical protein
MTAVVSYISGLDLGKRQDYSALACVEQTRHGDGPAKYGVRALTRWPLNTEYTAIVEEVVKLFAAPPLAGTCLVIDGTGVGAAVVDLFRRSGVRASVVEVLITGGHAVSRDERGVVHVAKTQLGSTLVALEGQRRLEVAPKLKLRAALERELSTFSARITPAGNEQVLADPRSGEHDDLVLAVVLPCFYGERFHAGPWQVTRDRSNRSIVANAPPGVFLDQGENDWSDEPYPSPRQVYGGGPA